MAADPNFDYDAVIIGAGISGLVTAKYCLEAGLRTAVLEKDTDLGGVWLYRDHGYGVMDFTHINVSKHNYCFSDWPFPHDAPDFPHHAVLMDYVRSYVEHFKLLPVIRFSCAVRSLRQISEGEGWALETEQGQTLRSRFVAVCTGHHAAPLRPALPGQDSFPGTLLHSVDYKSAQQNGVAGKRLLVVGIGNSAIDIATQAVGHAAPPVQLSTRSGAWVIPNYIFGQPVDLFACRLLLWLPWRVGTFVFEKAVTLMSGSPFKWGLNPTMHALQSQPTISPILIHCIQRRLITIKPDVERIMGDTVHFTDGTTAAADVIVCCTGYQIALPFLDDTLRRAVLPDETTLRLFKNVFSPEIGYSLAFIGFVQPASGGILTMAETQARWWLHLCRGRCPPLPPPAAMDAAVRRDRQRVARRWTASRRHLLQQDPVLYNDAVSALFGAKPDVLRLLLTQPSLGFRLLVGSGGAAQWRLVGPDRWAGAERAVRAVPVTMFMQLCLAALLVAAAGSLAALWVLVGFALAG